MAGSIESTWKRVSASLTPTIWDDVAQKMREWMVDVSTSSEVFDRRVPLPARRSPPLYLSTGAWLLRRVFETMCDVLSAFGIHAAQLRLSSTTGYTRSRRGSEFRILQT